MRIPLTRREAIKTLGTLTAGGALGGMAMWTSGKETQDGGIKGGSLRIAHLTDIHVQPGNASRRGLARCLRHVHSLRDQPDLILNGGDAIGDAMQADRSSTRAQWDLWQKVVRDECSLPIEHCLGNHDLWGGNGLADGKRWALNEYGLGERYRSSDRSGWHFIVLDSIHPGGNLYQARLDEEQFEWLRLDLRAVPKTMPVLVLSHIPILSACAFFDGDNEKTGNWVVPGAWMHLDARRLRDLFRQHSNVKLCLSGHIHLLDRVDYGGVSYVCNGAVSGNWWKGPYQDCAAGYGLIDLHDDGSFEHRYIRYA